MSKRDVTGLGAELDAIDSQASAALPLTTGVAILVGDETSRSVIEDAVHQIEALPTLFDVDLGENSEVLRFDALDSFEMIIADESLIDRLRGMLTARDDQKAGFQPALIAVRQAVEDLTAMTAVEGPDGMLLLSMPPAAIAAQLSLLLYAHRAYARRYQTAMEELHLNRRIFGSVTSGISIASALLPDLPLVYVNPAFEAMTGYSFAEVQGRNCRFLQGNERNQASILQLRTAIGGQTEVAVLLRNFRKDGSMFWNELSMSPIRNRSGEVTHFVGIQQDVTARMDFEAALRESEKLAAVGRLASSIAHEINNPLESVMNLLYLGQQALAQNAPLPEDAVQEAQHYLSLADKELQRVAQITSQSLRFYRQSSRPHLTEPSDLLDSVLDLYEGRLVNAAVKIGRQDCARTLLMCLDSEVRQVLSNLVRNAIDSMQADGGRLLVRSRDAKDAKTGSRGVVFTVADTGSGISQKTMGTLFRPFLTTKGIAGTGLGLWISREIVARHHGWMRVRSRQADPEGPGVRSGTVFRMFVPAEWTGQEIR